MNLRNLIVSMLAVSLFDPCVAISQEVDLEAVDELLEGVEKKRYKVKKSEPMDPSQAVQVTEDELNKLTDSANIKMKKSKKKKRKKIRIPKKPLKDLQMTKRKQRLTPDHESIEEKAAQDAYKKNMLPKAGSRWKKK